MTAPPPGLRFVRDPDLLRVSGLMQASWAEPCWVYDDPLLDYHLRRPSVDRDLLLGLEHEASGELVAYYALMPLLARIGHEDRRAVFGSFLTVAPAFRRLGAARALQVELLGRAISSGYEQYFAFCEVGSTSNESIVRSCAAIGLSTKALTRINYLALPAVVLAKRALAASGQVRPYAAGDRPTAAELPYRRRSPHLEGRHDRRDLEHRWAASIARTYVLPTANNIEALAHLVVLSVRDGGRVFRNLYLREFEPGALDRTGQEQFLCDVLRAAVEEGGNHAVLAPACESSPVDLLMRLGFRPMSRGLDLLATPLRAGSRLTIAGPHVDFRLDVF